MPEVTKSEIYYTNTDTWTSNDFDVIDRIFSNIISDYSIPEDSPMKKLDFRGHKLKKMDLTLMDPKVKAILYCVIIFHKREDLFDLPNLLELKTLAPLEETLIINERPMNLKGKKYNRYPVYEKMNIRY